jgi:integrase
MASVWIARRPRKSGGVSFRVMFRLGGRETMPRYGGAFPTMREAKIRRDLIAGELAARRVPDLHSPAEVTSPTLREAVAAWRASRIDVSEGTRVLHRVALQRALPLLGDRRVDTITVEDVNELVVALSAAGKKRETIRKTVKYLFAVLRENGVEIERTHVRFPYEQPDEIEPPLAEHVEAVVRLLPSSYRLALLWLDWSGARLGSVDSLLVSDYDEPQRRVRLRASTQKTRTALWVDLPEALAEALEQTLGPRDDRDLDARLFPNVGADRLRTAIARAARAAGVPVFSPHDLRHRRISLLHHQGRSWAEIARLVGQRKLSVTADTYTHVLTDGRELDYATLLP